MGRRMISGRLKAQGSFILGRYFTRGNVVRDDSMKEMLAGGRVMTEGTFVLEDKIQRSIISGMIK